MPKICNVYSPACTNLRMDLTDGPGYIFDHTQADHLNWIPVDLQLTTPCEKLTFFTPPTLSVEGIKVLLTRFRDLFRERESVGACQHLDYPFKQFCYTATEGEFDIILQNSCESDFASVTVWMNMACCIPNGEGLAKGARFYVCLDELKQFYSDLSRQFHELTIQSY